MKSILQTLMNLCPRLLSLFKKKTTIYSVQVCDCYYCEDHGEYLAVLHKIGNPTSFTLPIREIIANKQLLSCIDPIQASSLGWIARDMQYKQAANDHVYQNKDSL